MQEPDQLARGQTGDVLVWHAHVVYAHTPPAIGLLLNSYKLV